MEDPRPYDSSEYFEREDAAKNLRDALGGGARVCIVLAPDLAGKRWLVSQVLPERVPPRVLWVDARLVQGPADVAAQIATGAGEDAPRNVTAPSHLGAFLVRLLDQPTVIVWRHAEALDDPDRPRGAEIRHTLREWSSAGGYRATFGRLQQVLLTSSPSVQALYWANSSDALIPIPDLGPGAVTALSRRLQASLPDAAGARLHGAIGGHPYYLRLAVLHREPGLSLEELCENPVHPRGPFVELCRQFQRRLERASRDERAGARRLLESGEPPRGPLADELERRGVLQRGKSGFRYPLFRAFLRNYFER